MFVARNPFSHRRRRKWGGHGEGIFKSIEKKIILNPTPRVAPTFVNLRGARRVGNTRREKPLFTMPAPSKKGSGKQSKAGHREAIEREYAEAQRIKVIAENFCPESEPECAGFTAARDGLRRGRMRRTHAFILDHYNILMKLLL